MRKLTIEEHLAEEAYLESVEIDRYWLSWDAVDGTGDGDTIGYYPTPETARTDFELSIKSDPTIHYYIIDLETGEELEHYVPND